MEPKFCQKCNEIDKDIIVPCSLLCGDPRCAAYKPMPTINALATPIFWVLGGPGIGKGVQSIRLAKKYKFEHISTGDLLRADVESRSPRSKCLENVMKRGGLVPAEVVIDLLKKAILKNVNGCNGFLIDGYPREPEQSYAFEKQIAPVTGIIYYEASTATMLKRLHHRMQVAPRLDDNVEMIQKRLALFEKHKDSVLRHYRTKILAIDAERDVETVFQQTVRLIEPILGHCKQLYELEKATAEEEKKNKIKFHQK